MSSPHNQRRLHNRQALDHFSDLPDTILWHILSFVPTKSTVKTSVLAKRWRYLWTKVPTLDFTEFPDTAFISSLTWRQKICFRNFVDRVLLHNDVYHVQHLRLQLTENDYVYINSWLSAITRREIRDIDIWLHCSTRQVEPLEPVVLPPTFLSSARLVCLKLKGEFAIKATMPLHLPNLVTVLLSGVKLPNDKFMKILSSGCPILKELRIINCNGIVSTLYVESLTLKSLEIKSTMDHAKLQEARLVIKAPNLRYLHFFEEALAYHVNVIGQLSLLEEADLDFQDICDVEHAFELVRMFSEVHTLRLGNHELFRYVSNPPIFQNLTCLTFSSDNNTHLLLECAPKLKFLTLEMVFSEDEPLESKPVPKCMSSLESIDFNNFEGFWDNMMLAAYFLKTASFLKEMKICQGNSFLLREIDVYQKLLMLPRSSPACQIKIYRYP